MCSSFETDVKSSSHWIKLIINIINAVSIVVVVELNVPSIVACDCFVCDIIEYMYIKENYNVYSLNLHIANLKRWDHYR
jgi:hypothetical protein